MITISTLSQQFQNPIDKSYKQRQNLYPLLIYMTVRVQTDKISQQPENCENRNDPDLVQAFLKKW
jgi:hypothetical protein